MVKKIILVGILASTSLLAVESQDLYRMCAQCHGMQADKIAVKRSPRLSTLSENELSTRLKNILDGSSSMSKKFVTMHQIKLKYLTAEKTDEFAKYILSLKKD